jgi:peptide/nickel transport system substrate-binding protein
LKRLVSILAAIAVVAGGCASVSGTVPVHPDGLKTGGTLTVGMVGDMTYADPALAADASSRYVANQVVEGLVGLAPGTSSTVVPVLASALPTVSADGLAYTFKLRSGIKFHDGSALDASAVKFNYDRWSSFPKKGDLQSAATVFGTVFGGFGEDGNLASVAAPDAQTVVMTLRKPQSNFLITQANVAFGIQSPKAIQDNDGNDPSLSKNTYALGRGGQGKAMVGTGPFMFSEWVPGDHVTLVKNPSYWNQAGAPYLDKLVFKPFDDAVSAGNALQSGAVDMVDLVDPTTLRSMRGSSNVTVLDRGYSCNVTQLAMNEGDTVNGALNSLADVNARMAIASALDRQSYVNDIYSGAAIVADNWAPEGALYYKPEYLPGYDSSEAKGYMAAAQLTGKVTLDLWYPSGTNSLVDYKALATAIAADLGSTGFTVNVKTEAAAQFATDSAAGKMQTWLMSQDCVWDSVDYFLSPFLYVAGAPSPSFSYTDDTMNATMEEALAATQPATVRSAWEQAQDLVRADMPTVPLVNAKLPAASRSYVRGVVSSGSMVEVLNTVWLDK